ncbi:drug/metabolite transporter (DMT)-like permease [Sphingobium sp. B2D3A]|uniref:hypothetical protein n=1 Tax=Sphingobium sp. B2D3A TaxID=2940579 RepID=UPI002224F5A3|nr:hypothetical protein [Sphingobium sp. B2D3A]MCW2338797.1 drug/metabolite transporter (DMT)-like permease [Sphingobium sp. B2D3A]
MARPILEIWCAVLLGLTGVVLIARPGGGLDVVGVMLALGAAILNGTYQLMSRTLAATEKTFALLFYSAAVGSLVFGAVAPFYWAGRMPTLLEGALLASLGLWGGVGHYLFTAAFRHARLRRWRRSRICRCCGRQCWAGSCSGMCRIRWRLSGC